MPHITANGIQLHYVERGSGDETVVFSHSYLLDWSHFEPQIATLASRYRCLAFDHRAHGSSELPPDTFGMEDVYEDAVAFIEAMDCAPVHFVGLSTGGFVGVRLGIRRPDLLRTLTLMDTSADTETKWKRIQYEALLRTVSLAGTKPFGGYVLSLFFSRHSRRNPGQATQLKRQREIIVANDRKAAVNFGRAIFSRASVEDQLDRITVPTLVLSGEEDQSQVPERARRMASGIPNAKLVMIPEAGHISTIDQPALVNAALEQHLRADD